jgi:hypothetical protein
MDEALFESRSLIKQLAMRRTLFVFPLELLPAALSGPSARVARQGYGRLVKDLERDCRPRAGDAGVGDTRALVTLE